MGTRSQFECNNVCWLPSATSTPLKPNKTNNDIEKDPGSLSTYYKNIVDIRNKERLEPKVPSACKVKKNKLSFYFEVSSSDDDEKLNERNRVPRIIINSQNITKKKSLKINQVNSKISLLNQGKVAKVVSKSKKKGKASKDLLESNISLSDDQCNDKCKAKIRTDKSITSEDSNFGLNTLSSGKKTIAHKGGSQNLLKENKKENSLNKIKVTEENKGSKDTFNVSNGSNVENQNIGQTKNLDFPEANDKLNKASISQSRENLILKDINSSFKKSKNQDKPNEKLNQGNKIVLSKRKGRKISDVTSPTKRRKRKEDEKLSKADKNFVENHFNNIHKMGNKIKNLSHQLFSDSKEQELINSLDLTSVDIDSKAQDLDSSEKKQRNSSLTTKTTVLKLKPDVSTFDQQCEEPKRPSRQRRVPKNFWLPQEDDSVDSYLKTVKLKQKNIIDSSRISSTSDKSFRNKKRPDNKKIEKRLEKNKSNVQKEPVKFEEECNIEDCAVQNPISSTIAGVFQHLNQVSSFEESQPGCLTAECLSLRNFKCGILKITCKSQLSSRTMFENCYFGGIIMRGDLKMQIGDKKKDIKEGDMVFVPPLTEWTATNTCQSEAIVYYWWGRFKS